MNDIELKFAVIAIDIVVFRIYRNKLQVRLIDIVKGEHFVGMRAFPGGLVRREETVVEAAMRILKDKADIKSNKLYLEQLHTYSAIDRDPRGRVVSVCHIAILNKNDNQEEIGWTNVDEVKSLAYDHKKMLTDATKKISVLMSVSTIAFKFLENEVTYSEIKNVIEVVLGKEVDKRNFYKRLKEVELLETTNQKRKEGEGRPAEIYKVKSNKVEFIRIF